MHYHLLEMKNVRSISDIRAYHVHREPNSHVLWDLVNKIAEIKAAAIFSHSYCMSTYVLFS